MTIEEKKQSLLKLCVTDLSVNQFTNGPHPIHFTEWGNSGPKILLIHGGVQGGIGGGPVNYINQRELADKGYQLRVADRPGFGESPSRGWDSQTADAIWIAEELGEAAHLVGHSFGGAEALLAAAIRPEKIKSLILIEPAIQLILTTDMESLAKPEIREALQVVTAPIMAANTPGEFAKEFVKRMGTGVGGGLNASQAALEAHPENAEALGSSLLNAVLATPQELRNAADIIKAKGLPVYVVSGGYSASQDFTCEALARLTGGKHVIIASPSHFIQQDSPKLFNGFLEKVIQDNEK
jgi:pimeloyl-ACP methyl ester carboxylesterase